MVLCDLVNDISDEVDGDSHAHASWFLFVPLEVKPSSNLAGSPKGKLENNYSRSPNHKAESKHRRELQALPDK